jgi:hypothetical protein
MVVPNHVSHERLLQSFTTGESMGFEHIGNAPIEAFDHAIGLGRAWLGQAIFNAQGLAQLVKLVLARGLTLTAGKQAVGERLAIVGQDFLQLDRASLVQGNHYDKAPGWTAGVTQRLSINWRMTSLVMNSGSVLSQWNNLGHGTS